MTENKPYKILLSAKGIEIKPLWYHRKYWKIQMNTPTTFFSSAQKKEAKVSQKLPFNSPKSTENLEGGAVSAGQ